MSEQGDMFFEIKRHALFSPCEKYRYALTREWDPMGRRMLWVMLNPSTADAMIDDPTITRCMTRARRLGYGSIEVVNLFAWRATDPSELLCIPDPVGPENDHWILWAAKRASTIVVGWGNHGHLLRRDFSVHRVLQDVDLQCLGVNASGTPKHPLYVSYDIDLIAFNKDCGGSANG